MRFLKNIMGLWLVQECRRTWERAGPYATLTTNWRSWPRRRRRSSAWSTRRRLLHPAAEHAGGAGRLLPPHRPAGAGEPGAVGPLRPGEPGTPLPLGPGRLEELTRPAPGGHPHRRRRQPERAAVPVHGRRLQPARAGRAGRGDGDRQRAGAGVGLGLLGSLAEAARWCGVRSRCAATRRSSRNAGKGRISDSWATWPDKRPQSGPRDADLTYGLICNKNANEKAGATAPCDLAKKPTEEPIHSAVPFDRETSP